ncbi:hypothetical protein EIP91_012193 [Steccherinum ochraceum]|uniref:Glutamine amidotransferase domain-containing protein n=1 Tax=Steccherinum ochraceum TaxID=92696 RepID=A0A4R0RV11_9APHY|nr:hypothetical protein EIP91_012193 [Steccherinum ochraceum]
MSSHPRIALFICDTPIPSVLAEDGDYEKIFNTLLHESRSDIQYTLDPYLVRKEDSEPEYPENVDKYDAIIITGSAASAYENLDWINLLVGYIADVAQTKPNIKLIAEAMSWDDVKGICFGHQIIARALGSPCVPNGGKWEVGITEVQLTEIGRQLFEDMTTITRFDLKNIQQMHRDHNPEIPESCHHLGSTAVCKNQGFIRYKPSSQHTPGSPINYGDIQIFTVQGHPEFTKRIVTKIVTARSGTGVIDKITAEDATRRADWRNDGVSVLGKVIWKIIAPALAA